MKWYEVKNVNQIDSPALLVYRDRIAPNIQAMIEQVGGDPDRLIPHVKTHKMREIIQMQMEAGITKFKCATIAELEMVLSAGAKKVVVAYQLVGPKIDRLLRVIQAYPEATIASLVDNLFSANELATAFRKKGLSANIYLDVDNGNHRTGLPLNEDTFSIVRQLVVIDNLNFKGLHVYDGQFRQPSFEMRKTEGDKAFFPVYALVQRIENELLMRPEVINGGSPAFSAAAQREGVICSPGTSILWDYGYAQIASELDLQWAAVLLTRVISKPLSDVITLDLGHKSVGSENPLNKRIYFLNLDNYEVIGHSEEHLKVRVNNAEDIPIGTVFYGIPYHVCPSVNLHDEAHVITDHQWQATWEVVARRRRITF